MIKSISLYLLWSATIMNLWAWYRMYKTKKELDKVLNHIYSADKIVIDKIRKEDFKA